MNLIVEEVVATMEQGVQNKELALNREVGKGAIEPMALNEEEGQEFGVEARKVEEGPRKTKEGTEVITGEKGEHEVLDFASGSLGCGSLCKLTDCLVLPKTDISHHSHTRGHISSAPLQLLGRLEVPQGCKYCR
jgi:hypothetical protein